MHIYMHIHAYSYVYIVFEQHLARSSGAREGTAPGKFFLLPPFLGVVHTLHDGVQPRQDLV